MMNLANTQREKVTIQSAENYAHQQLHQRLGSNAKHYPSYANGQRLNIEEVEWYSDVSLDVIKSLFRYISGHFGECVYAEGMKTMPENGANKRKENAGAGRTNHRELTHGGCRKELSAHARAADSVLLNSW